MKILQNKIVVGGLCIFIASILSFVLLPAINKSKEATAMVIKLQYDVMAGTQIDESMLKAVEIGAFGLSDNTIKDKEEIVGKYATEALRSDEILINDLFSEYVTDDKLDRIIAQDKKLISVTVTSNAASVANHLKSGDLVSIYCYVDGNVVIFPELKHLEVYGLENSELVDVERVADENAEKRAETITLVATEEQAQKLVYAEYSGHLHAVFEKRGGEH